jgi:chemotaxis protein CheD
MNHFLLPGSIHEMRTSTHYGVHAMEILINEMMNAGADRRTLQAKVFGGANVIHADHPLMMVGARNIEFIREFLATEGIPIVGERLGGKQGLFIYFFPQTFKVLVRPLPLSRFQQMEKKEIIYKGTLTQRIRQHQSQNITFFK